MTLSPTLSEHEQKVVTDHGSALASSLYMHRWSLDVLVTYDEGMLVLVVDGSGIHIGRLSMKENPSVDGSRRFESFYIDDKQVFERVYAPRQDGSWELIETELLLTPDAMFFA